MCLFAESGTDKQALEQGQAAVAQELLSGTLETAIRAELAALDAASTSLAAFHDGSGVPQKRALQQELMGGGGY